jgi:hypothetical protein
MILLFLEARIVSILVVDRLHMCGLHCQGVRLSPAAYVVGMVWYPHPEMLGLPRVRG